MAKAKLKADDVSQDEMGGIPEAQEQAAAPEPQERPDQKLKFARDKLARMEETQKVCFRLQNDLPALAEELKKLKYNEYEVTQLLEPKGTRGIPGYFKSDLERQKQYINFLSARVKPADSHAAGVESGQQQQAGERAP